MKRKLLFFGSIIAGMAAIIGFLLYHRKAEAKLMKTNESSFDYIEHADGSRLRLPDDPETRQLAMDALFHQPKKIPSRTERIWNGIGGFLLFYASVAIPYLIFGLFELGWAALLAIVYIFIFYKSGWQIRGNADAGTGFFIALILMFIVVLFITSSKLSTPCCQGAHYALHILA